MKKLIFAFIFVLIAAASSQAQTYQKDIVGTWKIDVLAFLEANNLPSEFASPSQEKELEKISMEFTAEGIVTIVTDETKSSPYKVQCNSIIFDNYTVEIKKLDKDHLVFKANGTFMAFKKLKKASK